MKKIAFFVGSNTHFNITRVIANHGWMLSGSFNLDLITTSPEAFGSATSYYTIYGDQYPANKIGHVRSLQSYRSNHTPDVILPPTRPVLYGTLVTPFTFDNNLRYIYRHSGEIFEYYKYLNGWRKIACFGARNIGGTIPLSRADRYIALGPTGKKQLEERGINSDEITILPPTISSDRFKHKSDDIPEPLEKINRDIVLFLGRRTRMKGIHVLEDIIPSVLDKRTDLQFVLIGNGDQDANVPKPVREHITLLDAVPPDEVPAYLSASDILILPSLSEGVPRVILEALYMDTPVLANSVGDIPTITNNTYQEKEEFVRLLSTYEQLPVDPIKQFLRSEMRSKYINFFEDV